MISFWDLDFDIGDFANPEWDPEKLFKTLKEHVKTLRNHNTNASYGYGKFNLTEYYLWFYSFKRNDKHYNIEDLVICDRILGIFEKCNFIKKHFYNKETKEWTVWEIIK